MLPIQFHIYHLSREVCQQSLQRLLRHLPCRQQSRLVLNPEILHPHRSLGPLRIDTIHLYPPRFPFLRNRLHKIHHCRLRRGIQAIKSPPPCIGTRRIKQQLPLRLFQIRETCHRHMHHPQIIHLHHPANILV